MLCKCLTIGLTSSQRFQSLHFLFQGLHQKRGNDTVQSSIPEDSKQWPEKMIKQSKHIEGQLTTELRIESQEGEVRQEGDNFCNGTFADFHERCH